MRSEFDFSKAKRGAVIAVPGNHFRVKDVLPMCVLQSLPNATGASEHVVLHGGP